MSAMHVLQRLGSKAASTKHFLNIFIAGIHDMEHTVGDERGHGLSKEE